MRRQIGFLLFLSLALAACNDSGTQPGPGGIAREDAEALDKAAAKLDAEMTELPE